MTLETVRPIKRKLRLSLFTLTGRPCQKASKSKTHFLFIGLFDVIFQEITRLSFKVCIKDSQGISKSHDPVTVDYAIVGGTS